MFSRKLYVAVLSFALGLSGPAMLSAPAHADNGASGGTGRFVLSMDAGVEAWGGDIKYQIGYPVTDASGTYHGYFPFSELTFPLDVAFGVVRAEALIADVFEIGLTVKKNVSDPNDNMEDRDWVTPTNTNRLDIYSESEVTDFDATIFDVDASYYFIRNEKYSLGAGAGYMHQSFEYQTALIRQWSPSGLPGYGYVGDGSTSIIYEAEMEIPYLSFSGSFNPIPALTLNGRFAYAPWVSVDDKDQHLLRSKVNTGDLDGSAILFNIEAEYDITSKFFVSGGFDYLYLEADGNMDASFYGVYDHTVAEEFDSSQASLYATIGFRLGVPAQQ